MRPCERGHFGLPRRGTYLETLAHTDALDERLELAALLERGCRHIVSNLPGMEDRGKVTYSRS